MKYKTDQLSSKLLPLVDAGKHYIITEVPDFSYLQDRTLERALLQVRSIIGSAMRAALQLHGTYDDIIVCHKMIGTYPWKRHRITKAQHLHFVWSQFTNLCYCFEERFKLFMTFQHRTAEIFKKKKLGSIADGTKKVRKGLGPHIRQRGQNTHEWSTSNPHAKHFEAIEFINSIEEQLTGPLSNVSGQFRLTRMLMRWEIEAAIKFMESFLIELFDQQIPELTGLAAIFNELVEKTRSGEASMRDKQIAIHRGT